MIARRSGDRPNARLIPVSIPGQERSGSEEPRQELRSSPHIELAISTREMNLDSPARDTKELPDLLRPVGGLISGFVLHPRWAVESLAARAPGDVIAVLRLADKVIRAMPAGRVIVVNARTSALRARYTRRGFTAGKGSTLFMITRPG